MRFHRHRAAQPVSLGALLRAGLVAVWLLSPIGPTSAAACADDSMSVLVPETTVVEAPADAVEAEPPPAAPPAADPGPVVVAQMSAASPYLEQLVGEINRRRDRAGTPRLAIAPEHANAALVRYLADLTPMMLATGRCFHGDGVNVRPGWDYVAEAGFVAEGHGEVIACPGPEGFWTAPRIADVWWGSPHHAGILYGDRDANLVACGTYGPQRGGSAYLTIVCVTYRS